MQTDGRHKIAYLANIFIFTLYSQYIICESQHFMVSIRSHSVFHIPTWFSTKLLPPHMLPRLLPTACNEQWNCCSSALSSTLLSKYQASPGSTKEVYATKVWKDGITTKGHIPDQGIQKFHRNKIVFPSIEILKDLCPLFFMW